VIFDDLQRNITSIQNSLDKICVQAMASHSDEIIDLNTSQLEEGLSKDGISLSPELSDEGYAQEKISLGGKADLYTPDLHNEGNFYKGFYTEERNDGLYIDSNDKKATDLQMKYDGIYGIMPNNIPVLGEIVIPDIQETIKNDITRL
jgi:hypothetical protein